MSNAFLALIWWVVPAAGLIGALGYVLWVTKFQSKFQHETKRSVDRFQRFQDSLRDSQARDVNAVDKSISTELPKLFDQEKIEPNTFASNRDAQPKPTQQ
jgi:formiminotetrahydrofolate cyclodeaminase